MRTTAFAIAILMSGAAFAQTTTDTGADINADVNVQTDTMTDMDASHDMSTHSDMTADTDTGLTTDTTVGTDLTTGTDTTVATDLTTSTDTTTYSTAPTDTTFAATMTPASGAIVAPSNADPEHDARGIAVLSDPAAVPAGWNGVTGTAMGGPLVDPASGEAMATADASYPACTASVTDNCLQAYERGRSD